MGEPGELSEQATNYLATDMSQRKVAKVAAIVYLASFAMMVFTQINIHGRLILRKDAVETGRNN